MPIPGDLVHKKCHEKYINKKSIELAKKKKAEGSSPQKSLKKRLRSEGSTYDPLNQCLFCCKSEKVSHKAKGSRNPSKLIAVSTKERFQETLQQALAKRSDSWALQVQGRLEYLQDCRAKDVKYHNACRTHFCSELKIPAKFSSEGPAAKKQCVGRPEDHECAAAFQEVVHYLENMDYDQITMNDLVKMQQEKLSQGSAYGVQYMKKKLIDYLGERVFIGERDGKADVVSLRRTVSDILHDLHKKQKKEKSDESMHIIKAAAELVRKDIKSMECDKTSYPSFSDMAEESQLDFIPPSLRILLGEIFRGKDVNIKIASIGQARDHKDTQILVSFLTERSPFIPDPSLKSIASGRVADGKVNADNARDVGKSIMEGMTSKSVLDVVIRKKNLAITLDSKLAVTVSGDPVIVDPLVLFQRLL